MSNHDIIPNYEHYDASILFSLCENLENTDWSGKEEEAINLYDSALAEINHFRGIYRVISIMYDENLYDEYIEQEYYYSDSLYTRTIDSFYTAVHSLTQGPCAEKLKEHVNQYDYDFFYDYVPASDEEISLSEYLTTLETEYSMYINSVIDTVTFNYNGKEHLFGDLFDKEFYETEEIDKDTKNKIYADCMKQINEKVGIIFLEIVRTNNRIAELKGYDSFCEYADKEIFGRDFSTEDLMPYYDTIKNFSSNASALNENCFLADLKVSADEQVCMTGKVLNGISDKLDKSYYYFWKNRLYSMGSESCRNDSGYTDTISGANTTPFIYNFLTNTLYDISSLVHESGHFANVYCANNLETRSVQYEVSEIHSTGLELLASNRYDRVFDKDDAQSLKAFGLFNALYCVTQGALYDEWQRQIYLNPNMSLEEINELFYQLSLEYGIEDSESLPYDWVFVTHNFLAPLYYISYSISAVSALQIWGVSLKDYSAAVKSWEYLIDKCEPYCYFRLMDEANIVPFTESEDVLKTLNLAYEALVEVMGFEDDTESVPKDEPQAA